MSMLLLVIEFADQFDSLQLELSIHHYPREARRNTAARQDRAWASVRFLAGGGHAIDHIVHSDHLARDGLDDLRRRLICR
jgi:hypothetical protein